MKIRPFYIIALSLIFLILAELFYAWLPFPFERTEKIMGTMVRVKVIGAGAPYWTKRAIYEIKEIDRVFSKYVEKSEISLINQLAGKAPLQVSSDTFDVISMAIRVNKLSKVAFDITLGNSEDLILDENLRKVYLKRRGVKIDLGGIGKGYAVECARRFLLKKGIKRAIIDMHSSIAVIGNSWRIGILDPRNRKLADRNQKILGTVVLNDGEALSTSAQYEQPGHIIDPQTGKPADKCLSVTVIAKDAALADALSTAAFVLGPKEGMKLIKALKLKGIIVGQDGTIWTSEPKLE